MKVLRQLKSKKILKSVLKGSLKTNVFLILLGIFFSTLALAAALTLTHKDNRIPSGASGCFSSQRTTVELDNDRTEDLRDIIWSNDGRMVFTTNANMDKSDFGDLDLSMNKVSTPFELNTVKTFLGTHTCDDIDGFDIDHPDFLAQGMSTETTAYRSIHVAQGGKIFYIMSAESEVHRFDLSTAFDFRTAVYVNEFDFNNHSIGGFSISRDGTKMYSLLATTDTPTLITYSLSTAFDLSLIHI